MNMKYITYSILAIALITAASGCNNLENDVVAINETPVAAENITLTNNTTNEIVENISENNTTGIPAEDIAVEIVLEK